MKVLHVVLGLILIAYSTFGLAQQTNTTTSSNDTSVIQVSGSAVPETNVYIAQEGDTMWDICDRFFGDPWYWPVLWSINPHITNPHWIFPGDTIYLTPPMPVAPQKLGFAVSESRYSTRAHKENVLARRVGFLSEKQVKSAGTIMYSREERKYLGQYDEIYVRFRGPRKIHVGDKFLIYKVVEDLKHPVSGRRLGYKVRYLGVVKVLSTKTKLKRAVIVSAFEEIKRGYKLVPYDSIKRLVPPVVNGARVSGHIVGGFTPVDVYAENDYVIIDRGSKDGVVPGNRFIITTRGDGIPEYNPDSLKDFPYEKIGEVMAVYVQKDVCLGVVTYSLKEIEKGAPADMIPGF